MTHAKLKIAMLAAAAAGFAGAASASTDFTIQAINDMSSWQDLGSSFTPGTTYQFTVIDPATLWSAGVNTPFSRESTAAGIPADEGYGQYTFDGYTFNYGALVGENNGTFFLIGTGTSMSGLSGEVLAGYWDSFYPDNSGSQTLSVSAVPEPATWAMMLAGFAGLGAAMRTRRPTATA